MSLSHQMNHNQLAGHLLDVLRCSPRITILMSGVGTNAGRLLASHWDYCRYQFISIFADRPGTGARVLAKHHGMSLFEPEQRLDSDRLTQELSRWLEHTRTEMLLCAGFMRVLPDNICLYWPGLNVHPADLTIRLPDGSARYGGLQAVPKVIADSQLFVRASVHLIRNPVDDGMVISTSRPLWINAAMKENPRVLHAKLRQEREHRLYPATLNFLHDNDANVSDFPLRDLA